MLAVTCRFPICLSSRNRSKGLVPVRKRSGPGAKWTSQSRVACRSAEEAGGVEATTRARGMSLVPARPRSFARICSAISASSELWPEGSSTIRLIWSRAARQRSTRSLVTFRRPFRTLSKAVSRWWVNAASSSKPNMAPEPLMVCMERNTRPTNSMSCGFLFRASRDDSSSTRISRASS